MINVFYFFYNFHIIKIVCNIQNSHFINLLKKLNKIVIRNLLDKKFVDFLQFVNIYGNVNFFH